MFPDRVAIVDGARRITYRELVCAQGVPGLPSYPDRARPRDARDGVTEEQLPEPVIGNRSVPGPWAQAYLQVRVELAGLEPATSWVRCIAWAEYGRRRSGEVPAFTGEACVPRRLLRRTPGYIQIRVATPAGSDQRSVAIEIAPVVAEPTIAFVVAKAPSAG